MQIATKTNMRTRTSLHTLVEHIREKGIADWTVARRALGATLATLGERLTDDEASALASTLPPELARIVEQAEYDADFDAAELYERCRRRTDVPPGRAREQTDVVLGVLGEVLDQRVVSRLERVLPESIARCLRERETGAPAPHASAARRVSGSTLATGRPGSSHPVSEASPPGGHSQSVAENEEPHAATKLSTSHGMTQERFDETLATGRPPGRQRPPA